MNERWKEWSIIAGGVTGTLLLLNSISVGNWLPLLMVLGGVMIAVLIVKASYPAYLAFGTLAPFGISLWFIQLIPILGLVLALCVCSVWLRAIVQRKAAPQAGRMDVLMAVFYLCLVGRYCIDPVFPGRALGISNDITGFRSWLDHLLGLITFLSLGRLITSLHDVQRLFRWLVIFGLAFTLILVILMFIPGMALNNTLARMGVFVAYFGNGWRRFVVLPGMGIFLIMASLLPALFGITSVQRLFCLAVGSVAVVAGGNRGSVLSLLIMVGVIWMLQKRRWAMGGLFIAVIALALTLNAMIGHGLARTETPWMRVMGAFSPRLSVQIGTADTMEWRLIRWRRAMEDIKMHPWIGLGYGGMRGYFGMLSDVHELSPDLDVERDLATGSTHNGYISTARALGLPITVLFGIIMLRRIAVHLKWAALLRLKDAALFEAHVALCAYLVMSLFILMVGSEIRNPAMWVFIVLSPIVEHLGSAFTTRPAVQPQPG
jgi:O-antigen ligase